MISKEECLRFKDEGYNIIPLVKSIYLNEDTPLCIYSKISDIGNTFLLESVYCPSFTSLRLVYRLLFSYCCQRLTENGKRVTGSE